MRMRTILATAALATAALIGGAATATATADDDPFNVPDVPTTACGVSSYLVSSNACTGGQDD